MNSVVAVYSLQHQRLTTDDNFLGGVENVEYENMIQKASMVYYFNPEMYAGVFIDIHPDKLEIVRSVYSLSAWLGEIGGFSSALIPIIQIVLPLLQFYSLEKYLISQLYHQQEEKDSELTETKLNDKQFLSFAESTIASRKDVQANYKNFFL